MSQTLSGGKFLPTIFAIFSKKDILLFTFKYHAKKLLFKIKLVTCPLRP